MNVAAFILLAFTLTWFVLLDGYDLGVGILHLVIARSDSERAESLATIGPFWSGNEVVLVAAGGMLFALFPRAYAVAFSGFYLPFTLALWLLMGRGMAIELRGYFQSDLWHGFWDVTFAVSSTLLALIFGVALGNVLRGVPLDAQGYFAGTFAFLLNGYALLVGVLALGALALHGAAFVAWRAEQLGSAARRSIRILWPVVFATFAMTTWATLRVHPMHFGAALAIAPATAVVALVAIACVRSDALRFMASGAYLLCLMLAAAQTLYPYLLPAYPVGSGGLDIYNSAPGVYSMGTGVVVFAAGLAAVAIYGTLSARKILKA
jgi:cytochrome d ubiquinol oxidase subunit II